VKKRSEDPDAEKGAVEKGDEAGRGSSRSETVQNGRLDTESSGVGETVVGHTDMPGSRREDAREGASRTGRDGGEDRERPRTEGRDANRDEERDRAPVGSGAGRGEER
jgi:hypothetical protein